MTKLAVDIALLPPVEVMERVVGLIKYEPDSVIRLDVKNCLPHITLVMGVLDEARVDEVQKVLKDIASKIRPFEVTLDQTNTFKIANGKKISEVAVALDTDLSQLHKDLMDGLRPLLTHDDVQTDMFFTPPEVAEISTTWVTDNYKNQSPDSFRPHITLGEGSVQQLPEPITFTVDRLIICHLGNYCTCRKILAEAKLATPLL